MAFTVTSPALLMLLSLWPAFVLRCASGTSTQMRGALTLASSHSTQLDKRRSGTDVYYIVELLDRLKVFAQGMQASEEHRHDNELTRLQASMDLGVANADKAVFETSIQKNEESRLEMRNANTEMLSFYYTLKAQLGAQGRAPSCAYLTCGDHALCVQYDATSAGGQGAVCECRSCFAGDGYTCAPAVCTPSKYFTAQSLLLHETPAWTPEIVEMHLAIFASKHIAVVWRDKAASNRGFMMLGNASESITWGPMSTIWNEGGGYGPVVTAVSTKRLAIAFRDAEQGGIGYLTSGDVNVGSLTTTLGTPLDFARNQAQQVSVVPLSGSRAVLLYAERVLDDEGTIQEAFGGAFLFHIQPGGGIEALGTYHFAETPVARIAATALSPTSFVVAFRAMPADNEEDGPSRELSAVWMGLEGSELVVDKDLTLGIEPNRRGMWSRDVALISQNLFAYTYQSGSEEKTKLQIVRVDPETHGMEVVGPPRVIGNGATPYVKSISVPYIASTPETFTMFQRPNEVGTAKVCGVSMRGRITGCHDVKWADTRVASVAASRLGDGRLIFAFTDESGNPFFQLIDSGGAASTS